MRFAWLQDQQAPNTEAVTEDTARWLLVSYNLVWWLPVVLPVLGVISYRTGFVGFLVVTICRALINAYRVNILPVEKGQRFPLRLP